MAAPATITENATPAAAQKQGTTGNRAYRRAAEHGKITNNSNQDRLVRKPELSEITSLSPSSIRRLELEGRFPKRLRLGGSACGWLLSEVNEWLLQRAAAR